MSAYQNGLTQLLEFKGNPAEFWALLTQTACQSVQAELAVLYALTNGENWQAVTLSPSLNKAPSLSQTVEASLLEQARQFGFATGIALGGAWRLAVLSFSIEAGKRDMLLVVHLGANALPESDVCQYFAALRLVPNLFESVRALRVSERDALRLVHALELLGRVLASNDFDQASLVVVNELAQRFACETVSLTWKKREGLRLRAISHAEKQERRSELSDLLEQAGQEALAQHCEIVWPNQGKQVTQAHQRYAQLQQPGHLLTLPIRSTDGTQLGSITLERQRMHFTTAEQWALRMLCDMLALPLQQLDSHSRPLYQRLAKELARSLPRQLKPETGEGKMLLRLSALAIFALMLVPLPYAIDAGALVKTDAMAYVGAPSDGYLESSKVTLGATVKAGEELFSLATRELKLERASVLADLAQYSREAEKRRALNQLPEMQIAESQVAQSQAKLQQIDYRIESASARSPIAGVIVEGEPGKNLGGAVKRGDSVVKIAALNHLYVEAAIPERDLSLCETGQNVRVTLLAAPEYTYTMKITRIIPAASVKDSQNSFPARLESATPLANWWRPGMSGVAKIDIGYRPLIWIATHRLIDYLRIVLWV